jgi:hypothetical protein
MRPELEPALLNRRQLLHSAGAVGVAAVASLLAAERAQAAKASGGLPALPHFTPRAKRVIYLCQSGAPSQIDLFDPKPAIKDRFKEELPDSIRMGQRLTGMTAGQASFPLAPSIFRFAQHGQSGAWLSELLPHTAAIADELCFIKSMHTEAINHDPAITFLQTGSQIAGRPSIGAWVAYGLGSENEDLPAFVVMTSRRSGDQPLYDRLWGSGFLPTRHQGVKFRRVGRSGALPFQSARDRFATAARDARRPGQVEWNCVGTERRPGDRHPDRAVRVGVPHAGVGPRADRHLGEPQAVLDLYGPDAPSRAHSPSTASWRGDSRSGACGSCSFTTAAGTSTRTCRATFAQQAGPPTSRPPPW